MNTEFNQQLYTEALNNLPDEIKKVIGESKWEQELLALASKHRLRIDQTATVENGLKNLMVGVIDVDTFFEEISDLELDIDVFEQLMNDIEIKIMQVIKDKIIAVTPGGATLPPDDISRDSILAEIENDVEIERPANNIVMPGGRTLPPASMEKVSVMPGMTGQTSVSMTPAAPMTEAQPKVDAAPVQKQPLSDRLGLRDIPAVAPSTASKPFLMSDAGTIEVSKSAISEGTPKTGWAPVPSTAISPQGIPVGMESGIQADPGTGLTMPTAPIATAAPQAQQTPRTITRATDPYREAIE